MEDNPEIKKLHSKFIVDWEIARKKSEQRAMIAFNILNQVDKTFKAYNNLCRAKDNEVAEEKEIFKVKMNTDLLGLPNDKDKVQYIDRAIKEYQGLEVQLSSKGEGHKARICKEILMDVLFPVKKAYDEARGKSVKQPKVLQVNNETIIFTHHPTNKKDTGQLIDKAASEEILEKPLLNRNGNKLNNATYIKSIRAFKWKKETAISLISSYLHKEGKIKIEQVKEMESFLLTGKSRNKVLFNDKAIWFSTFFYILIKEKVLSVAKDYLAEQTAKTFLQGDNSMNYLIKKSTFKANMKPVNTHRRLLETDDEHIKIYAFIRSISKSY